MFFFALKNEIYTINRCAKTIVKSFLLCKIDTKKMEYQSKILDFILQINTADILAIIKNEKF